MNRTSSPFRLPEDAPVDLSPAAVGRYRVLAEIERNKAMRGFFRRIFGSRTQNVGGGRHAAAPAE